MSRGGLPYGLRSPGPLPGLEETIRELERFLSGPPEAGSDLRSFLLVERYLAMALGHRPTPLRRSLDRALCVAAGLAATAGHRAEVREVRAGPPPGPGRHLLFFGFPWSDKRHTGILEGLLGHLALEEVLAVTHREDVFEALAAHPVPRFLLRLPRLAPPAPGAARDPGEARTLATAALLLGAATRLLEELRPRSVLTTQDFHLHDQAFARAARALGVPSVTHQHGMIPPEPLSLYRFLFSDRMAVWGRGSARLMARFVDPARLWVVGTDRFDGLRSPRPSAERDLLVLALSPEPGDGNRRLVDAVSRGLAESPVPALRRILKLHPSMDPGPWERPASRAAGGGWEVLRGAGGILLPRTRFLLARRSTITLDAAVAGASVLELGTSDLGPLPGLLEELPESVVEPHAAAAEIARRLADPAVEAGVLGRQAAALDAEIEPGCAAVREVALLRNL
ncbi:MAG: hypothetical protein FJ098_00855 [Deltaproteobacteria bacterium]|nr:hypothetical protein [Deltaproteobacteria bacterium]